MDNGVQNKEIITVKNRKLFTMNGVSHIVELDESYISLETADGRVNVGGEGLKVDALLKNDGEISVVGMIRYLEFEGKDKKAKKHR